MKSGRNMTPDSYQRFVVTDALNTTGGETDAAYKLEETSDN